MKRIIILIAFALFLTGCGTVQEIEGSSGQVKQGFWKDYLDSYQMQGNGSMRLYRRYSDVDAYCVLDKNLQQEIQRAFHEGVERTYVVSYRGYKASEFSYTRSDLTVGQCYTETNMDLWIVTDFSAP